MIEQQKNSRKLPKSDEIYNEHVDCAMLHGVLTTLYTEMFTTKQVESSLRASKSNAVLIAGWGQAFQRHERFDRTFRSTYPWALERLRRPLEVRRRR